MKIDSTIKRQGATNPRRVSPQEGFPHDRYKDTVEFTKPKLGEKAKSSIKTLANGAVAGAATGVVGSILISPLFFNGSNLAAVFGWGMGVGTALGASVGSLVGWITPDAVNREAQSRHNALHDVVEASNLSPNESKTANSWSEISNLDGNLADIPKEKTHALEEILGEFRARGHKMNVSSTEAVKALRYHQLVIDGEKIDSLTELQFKDALEGGGMAILDDARRETVENLAGMAHRGFSFGVWNDARFVTETIGVKQAASKLYENGFHSDEQAFANSVFVTHKSGESYPVPDRVSLREVDYVVGNGPEVPELKPVVDGLKWLREQKLKFIHSNGEVHEKFRQFINASQGQTELVSGGPVLEIPSEEFLDTIASMQTVGSEMAFQAHKTLWETTKKDAPTVPSELTRMVLKGAGSQEQLELRTNQALSIYAKHRQFSKAFFQEVRGALHS